MRSWDFRYAFPCNQFNTFRSSRDFELITSALASTARHIDEFIFYQSSFAVAERLSTFHKFPEVSILSSLGYYAYRNLTSFKIKVSSNMSQLRDLWVDMGSKRELDDFDLLKCMSNPSQGLHFLLVESH